MKKNLAILLAMSMILSLTSCSQGTEKKTAAETTPSAAASVKKPEQQSSQASTKAEDVQSLSEALDQQGKKQASSEDPTLDPDMRAVLEMYEKEEKERASQDPAKDAAAAEALKQYYGEWLLKSVEGKEVKADTFEFLKDTMKFELGDTCFLLMENESQDFEFTEKDGKLISKKPVALGSHAIIEDGVLSLRNVEKEDEAIFIFEKVSDVAAEDPYWYHGSYIPTKVRENKDGAEWQETGYKDDLSDHPYLDLGSGTSHNMGGIFPGMWTARLDPDTMILKARSSESDETCEASVERDHDALIITCKDKVYYYEKVR